MYEPIDKEFVETVNDTNNEKNVAKKSSDLNENEDRDRFVDEFLSKYLGNEKLREKNSLREKIKHKRQQIELASKHIRKDRQAKAKQEEKKKNKNALSCKLKKKLGLFKLDKNEKIDYEKYESIHTLWQSYLNSCLISLLPDNPNKPANLNEENVLNVLKQIDYHGCKLKVVRSSNSKYQIGITGIVLQDKRNAFFLLTKENEIKIIPKQGSLFEFEIFDFKFTLVGSNMCYRPEIRTTKHAKIKTKTNIF
jgi:RNase P/RNase MRP subunit p29